MKLRSPLSIAGFLVLVALLLSVTTAPGCASGRPPNLSPAADAAYTADQVVIRINELMNAAIAAHAQNALPTNATRTIVKFAVAADQTLADVPAGWQATVRAAWLATKKQLPAQTNPAILAAMGAVDLVLGVL